MTGGIKSVLRGAFDGLPVWLKSGLKQELTCRAMRSRHHAAKRQLIDVATHLSACCLSDIRSREDWLLRQPGVRQQLLEMLGLDPFPERGPLNASITGVVERPGYRVERVIFESLPGLYVTGNFYLPVSCAGPVPCVVYLCGHWPSLDGAKTGFQDRYLWYPVNGFALLVLDPMGFGEVPGLHPGMNRLNQWHWLSLGYTPAGVEVWNAMRALDWLENRSEIDSAKIGVTGVSGGGVMTQFLAALDERVAAAVATCSTYNIGSQAALGLIPEQCDCTFYPNVFRIDFPEVLALIAPRPFLILGGRKDPIFPPAGFREAFQRTKKIYDYFDESGPAEPRLRLVESGQGHMDPPHFLDETHRWMCRWLRPLDGREGVTEVPDPERPEALRCLAERPESALNYSIHDVWIKASSLSVPATLEGWVRRKEILLDQLRSKVFGWFSSDEVPFKTRRLSVSGGYAGQFAEFGEFEFDTEPGVPVSACLLRPIGKAGPLPLIIWVRGASDHVGFPDIGEFHPFLRTHALAILTPRFADRPLDGRETARVERTAALTGRSVAALQVLDLLRCVAWLTRDRGLVCSEVSVYGRGHAGITGLYAALMDSTLTHVVLRDPPLSHWDGPALPMILRDTDLDESAGILAPRRLTILSHRREGFARTRSLFDLTGAGAAFGYAASLPEALLGLQQSIQALEGGNSRHVD